MENDDVKSDDVVSGSAAPEELEVVAGSAAPEELLALLAPPPEPLLASELAGSPPSDSEPLSSPPDPEPPDPGVTEPEIAPAANVTSSSQYKRERDMPNEILTRSARAGERRRNDGRRRTHRRVRRRGDGRHRLALVQSLKDISTVARDGNCEGYEGERKEGRRDQASLKKMHDDVVRKVVKVVPQSLRVKGILTIVRRTRMVG